LLFWWDHSSLVFMSSNNRIYFSFWIFCSNIYILLYHTNRSYFHTWSWSSRLWNIWILRVWLFQRFSSSWNLLIIFVKFDCLHIMVNGIGAGLSSIIEHSFWSLVSTFCNATWSDSGFNSMRLKHCSIWNYNLAVLPISI